MTVCSSYDDNTNYITWTIVQRKLVQTAGWTGHPVVQQLINAGGQPEKWKPIAYFVPLVDRDWNNMIP